MPKLEKSIELKAKVENVYSVLRDYMGLPRWNIVVNEITEVEKDKYLLKTTVGDMFNIQYEDVPNKKMSSTQENSPMEKIGYIFESKGDTTVVTLWSEFELEDQRSVLDIAADLFLKSLKVYVDYLESGGDPKQYVKKFSKIRKA